MKRRASLITVMVVPVILIASLAVLIIRWGGHHRDVYTAPPPGPPAHAALAPAPRIGVFEPGTPQSFAPVRAFTAASGVRPGIVLYYSGWWQPFARRFAERAYQASAVPLVQMIPYGRGVSVRQVIAGQYDGYLRTFADQVRRYGHPVIIGFAPEPNGRWYDWGWTRLPSAAWIAAWRHVVTTFRDQGALNVTWLWTINRTVNRSARIRDWWPGHQYVTWVGVDGYYVQPGDRFTRLFAPTLRAVRHLTDDPVLISETAAGPSTGNVPAKIADLFAGVRAYHLAGVVWFDKSQHQGLAHQDWRLEGHPATLAAFRKAVASLVLVHAAAGEGTVRLLRH